MPHPESFIAPMPEELTRLGCWSDEHLEVDAVVRQKAATVMMVVNAICGCAVGKARPGVALALKHTVKPDVVATVFAGADIEATERGRSYLAAHLPSSPSIAILRDGQLVYMLERHQTENQTAAIARILTEAFDRFCASAAQRAQA